MCIRRVIRRICPIFAHSIFTINSAWNQVTTSVLDMLKKKVLSLCHSSFTAGSINPKVRNQEISQLYLSITSARNEILTSFLHTAVKELETLKFYGTKIERFSQTYLKMKQLPNSRPKLQCAKMGHILWFTNGTYSQDHPVLIQYC